MSYYGNSVYWSSYYSAYRSRHSDEMGRAGMKVVVEPVNEQLSVEDVALHLRLDALGSPPAYTEQAWIEAAIPAARELCETLSGLALAPQTLTIGLPAFPCHWGWGWSRHGVSLLVGPILGVGTVAYDVDGSGTLVALDPSAYVLDDFIRPPMLYPAYNTSWPNAALMPNAVRITFNAGYTTPNDSPNDMPLPKSIRHAMLLVIGHLFENREQTTAVKMEEIPLGVSSLLARNRMRLGIA